MGDDLVVPSLISVLLEKIEALYKTALALTIESEPEENEIRKETLEKADLIFQEIAQHLSVEQIAEQDFLDHKERLLHLADQIRKIDQKRAILIQEEQALLDASLQSFYLGKKALSQYQKTIPT